MVGAADGALVGEATGALVGAAVGAEVGAADGAEVGTAVGAAVGTGTGEDPTETEIIWVAVPLAACQFPLFALLTIQAFS